MEDYKLECYKYTMGEKFMRENEYPVYPEDDGYDQKIANAIAALYDDDAITGMLD